MANNTHKRTLRRSIGNNKRSRELTAEEKRNIQLNKKKRKKQSRQSRKQNRK